MFALQRLRAFSSTAASSQRKLAVSAQSLERAFEKRVSPVLGSRFVCFEDARDFVHMFDFKTKKEWREFSKSGRPKWIPSNPDKTYDEFTDWVDWLGSVDKYCRTSEVRTADSNPKATPSSSASTGAVDTANRDDIRSISASSSSESKDSVETMINPVYQSGDECWSVRKAAKRYTSTAAEKRKPTGLPHSQFRNNVQTKEWLIENVTRSCPDLEFYRLPSRTPVDLLFRVRSPEEEATSTFDGKGGHVETTWAALQVLSKRHFLNKRTFKMNKCQGITTGVICVIHHEGDHVYFVHSDDVSGCNVYVPCGRVGEMSELADIGPQLRQWWTILPKFTLPNIIARIASKPSEVLTFRLSALVDERLYIPAGVKWHYTGLSQPHNGMLNEFTTSQSRAFRKNNRYIVSLQRRFDGAFIPFDLSDEVDLLTFLIMQENSDELAGVFVAPFHAFTDYWSGGEDFKVGLRHISLYPPFAEANREKAALRKQAQSQYYYDLSSPEACAESQKKLREFLREFEESRTVEK